MKLSTCACTFEGQLSEELRRAAQRNLPSAHSVGKVNSNVACHACDLGRIRVCFILYVTYLKGTRLDGVCLLGGSHSWWLASFTWCPLVLRLSFVVVCVTSVALSR